MERDLRILRMVAVQDEIRRQPRVVTFAAPPHRPALPDDLADRFEEYLLNGPASKEEEQALDAEMGAALSRKRAPDMGGGVERP